MKQYKKKTPSLTKFIELCALINTSKEMSDFFDLFLTIEEKEVISARFVIIHALLEGKYTQREIAERYHVSISQITRGSNALKIASPRLIKLLKE